MFDRTSSGAHSSPLKRTVLISHGEKARRIGRIRREVALSGALPVERTPHFARSFLLLRNVRQNVRTGWRREEDLNSRNPSEFNAPQRRAHSDDQFTTGLEFWTIRNENLIYPTTQAHAAAPQLCSTRTSWFAEGPHHAPGNRQIVRSDRPRRKALSACQQISPQKARRPAQRSQRYWADPNSAADVLSSRRPQKLSQTSKPLSKRLTKARDQENHDANRCDCAGSP
jgi:hypothetical protein